MYLKICAYCCCCLFGMCRLFVQSLVLSSYHSVCLCLCTEVFWCWKWKDVSPSCVRLLARCLSHAMPVSLWECSLVKKSVSGGESCKKKEIDKKNLYLKKRKVEEDGLLLFFHVNIECYIHIIYILYTCSVCYNTCEVSFPIFSVCLMELSTLLSRADFFCVFLCIFSRLCSHLLQ